MSRIITLIERTTPILEAAEAEYEKVNKDNKLRLVFHQAGKGLALVKKTLELVKPHLQNRDLGGGLEDAKNSIKACTRKVTSAEWMFRQVALAPENSRFGVYNKLLAREGKQYMVEVLVQGMMKDVCELVKQSGIEERMQDEVEDLRDAINAFEDMVPSAPTEEKGHNVSNFGDGDQFSAAGFAEQNNNTGSGNQLPGGVFNREVNFGGQAPEQKPKGNSKSD
ncbi:hypothetical protein SNK04_013591 [Fusarium graminearum]